MEKVCTNGHVFKLEQCDRCGCKEPQTEIPTIKVKRTRKAKTTPKTKTVKKGVTKGKGKGKGKTKTKKK